MSRILVVADNPPLTEMIEKTLGGDGHSVVQAPDAQRGVAVLAEQPVDLVIGDLALQENAVAFLERLRRDHENAKCIMMSGDETSDTVIGALRGHVCALLTKPFTAAELRASVNVSLARCPAAGIEVVSARTDWVELLIPCDLADVPPLEQLLGRLDADLPEDMREAIAYAFREMLSNAIEHGCNLDPAKRVQVSYVRFRRAIICSIKDPGEGFDPARLEHAAVSNPGDDPVHHLMVREEKGLRPGGFGILMTNQMVDELVYNERHNELMFIKYLP
ncbi:MAG TPA: ATP-binding protein [Blastocatellia bacterium]|nr:ATP-binding protein [Blastocatellia bacterium]